MNTTPKKRLSKFTTQIEMNNQIKYEMFDNEIDDYLSFDKKYSLEKKRLSLKEQLKEDEEELKLKLICSEILTQSQSKSTNGSSFVLEEEGLSQIAKEEKTYKFIILGDKQVGKSILKQRLLGETEVMSILPTQTMDIKKRLLSYKNYIRKFEIFDTNLQTQNSPIIQSKFNIIIL